MTGDRAAGYLTAMPRRPPPEAAAVTRACGRLALWLALLLAVASFPPGARAEEPPEEPGAQQPAAVPGRTGLPLPRFVSLRAAEVNLRTGPGTRYPIDWVYQRRGMPVEIVDEFDTWRRIRDWQGTEGWVHQSMVQGQRGILVTGKRQTLRRRPEPDSPGVALVDAGVVGVLKRCQLDWCEVAAGGFTGWLRRDAFYGLYPGEKLD
ncbi:MAG: SH3 domain-containing protein [Kiloniellaceae bacterium]